MTKKIPVDLAGLTALGQASMRAGTQDKFIPLALEWAVHANKRIQELEAELAAFVEIGGELQRLQAELRRLRTTLGKHDLAVMVRGDPRHIDEFVMDAPGSGD